MILHSTHTHLYPGHRGTVSGLDDIASLQSGQQCLVEFADGSATAATITGRGGDWRLQTQEYRTAAGTGIVPKRWRLRLDSSPERTQFRILGKA